MKNLVGFILIEEVELIESIVKCFVTGVMLFGFIFYEVYFILVIVMNCLGVKFNFGEGGEDLMCFELNVNGDLECLVIK